LRRKSWKREEKKEITKIGVKVKYQYHIQMKLLSLTLDEECEKLVITYFPDGT
jgi:hypothetical protein